MGDRGNVRIVDHDSTVYLYSHWGGSELPELTARVLAGRGAARLDDGSYLARIIFCEMVRDEIDDTTGFGISSTEGDGGVLVDIDVQAKTVNGIPREQWVAEQLAAPGVG